MMSNAIKIKDGSGTVLHVGDHAYTIEVTLPNESKAYHVGPGDYPYFEQEEADNLVVQINAVGTISPDDFVNGYGYPFDVSNTTRLELEEERQREDEIYFGW